MDVAGLAIGIAGLAGLFSTCADVLERVDTYRDFGITSRQLSLRFESEKIRLQEWANAVGITDSILKNQHHPKLDDPRIRKIVERFLVHIKDIFLTTGRLSNKNLRGSKSSDVGSDPWSTSEVDAGEFDRVFASSRWTKTKWAISREARFTKLVEGLEVVIEKLHVLVPLEVIRTTAEPSAATILDKDHDQSLALLNIDKELKSLIEDIRKKASLENLKLIDEVLRSPKIPDQLEVHLKTKLEDTCEWLLQSLIYQKWLSQDMTSNATRFLWLFGPPGCGKTILCSSIVQSLNETRAPLVFHFFSSLYVQADGKPEDVIRVWISQIARVNQKTLDLVYMQLEMSFFSLTFSSADLWRTFAKIVSQLDPCTFVLDGLDEYGLIDMACEDFLVNLKQALEQTSSAVLLTSRDEPAIRGQLVDHDTIDRRSKLYWHGITKEDNFADVNLYSQHIIKQKLGKKDTNLQRDLALQLAERCDGMFLWVSMSGKDLRSGLSRSRLERIIDEVPKGLLATYERNWQRILAQGYEDKTRAMKILQWCIFSVRPLTVAALTEALIVDVSNDTSELDLEELPDEIDLEYIETEIKAICGSLVDVKSPEPTTPPSFMTVQLVHISVKEYVLSTISNPEKGDSLLTRMPEFKQHGELAKVCLQYLCYTNVGEVVDDSNEHSIAFRQYALDNWIVHYRMSSSDDMAIHNLAAKFLDYNNANFRSWAIAHEDHELRNSLQLKSWLSRDDYLEHINANATSPQESHLGTPLYYAALFGLNACMKVLHSRDRSMVNKEGGRLSNALQATCLQGHLAAFNALLEWGADPDIEGALFGNALGAASFYGRTEFVEKLVDLSTETNTKGLGDITPLHSAAMHGYLDVVKLLLNKIADPDILDSNTWTPLNVASSYGHIEIVRLLLNKNADVEGQGKTSWTPLASAAECGHIEVVRLLLEQGGANVKAVTINGYTPLYVAIYHGHIEVTRLLLEHASQTDILTTHEETALNIAVRRGNCEIVKLLLDRGDKSSIDYRGETTLHHAARLGYLEIMRLLLSDPEINVDSPDEKDITPLGRTVYGAVELRDCQGWRPLHMAVANGHIELVRLLLEHSAPTQVINNRGWTPLNFAAIHNHIDIARLLIDYGADIQIASEAGWTPIHSCAIKGSAEMLRLLLDKHTGVKSYDTNGLNSMVPATSSNGAEAAFVLVDKATDNASFDVPDRKGRTPLIIASWRGHIEAVQLLLDRGSNVNAVDTVGMNALMAATYRGRDEIFQLLLTRGAELSSQDSDGVSCLHYAAMNGHTKLMQMIFDRGQKPLTIHDNCNMNALHYAASWGQLGAVKLLLEANARNLLSNSDRSDFVIPQSVDREGKSALHFAAEEGSVEVVDYLIENGFDMVSTDIVGKTILEYACLSGSEEMVQHVLQLNIQSCKRQNDQSSSWSPMHWACRAGSPEIIRLLAEAKISFKAVETSQPMVSWLPCDIARYFNNSELISNDGVFLGDHICEEMHEHEPVDTNSGNTISAISLGSATMERERYCDGCGGNIFGMLFRCRDCHPEHLDYCLMCKRDLERLHFGHQWDCIKPSLNRAPSIETLNDF